MTKNFAIIPIKTLTVLDLKIHAIYIISVLSSYIIPEEQKKQFNRNTTETNKIRTNRNKFILINFVLTETQLKPINFELIEILLKPINLLK